MTSTRIPKILVTGATGQVGSKTIDFLLDETPREAEARDAFLIRSGRWLGRRLGVVEPLRPPDIVVNGHGPTFIRMLRGAVTGKIAGTNAAGGQHDGE